MPPESELEELECRIKQLVENSGFQLDELSISNPAIDKDWRHRDLVQAFDSAGLVTYFLVDDERVPGTRLLWRLDGQPTHSPLEYWQGHHGPISSGAYTGFRLAVDCVGDNLIRPRQ